MPVAVAFEIADARAVEFADRSPPTRYVCTAVGRPVYHAGALPARNCDSTDLMTAEGDALYSLYSDFGTAV